MSLNTISCGLNYNIAPDLEECLTEAVHANYTFIVTPIIHPRLRRPHFKNAGVSTSVGDYTRSNMILTTEDWTTRIVGRLSSFLDVDSDSEIVRRRHEDYLNDELTYCRGLGLRAIMLFLHTKECNNLARNILTFYANRNVNFRMNPTWIWVRIPMFTRKLTRPRNQGLNVENSEESWNEPWYWWSKFHESVDWEKRIGVVLEVTRDLPPEHIVRRWLGEPVLAVMLPTSLFVEGGDGFPVLPPDHQKFVMSMVDNSAQVVVTGSGRWNKEYYNQHLHRLWDTKSLDDVVRNNARGYEDHIQIPLQPLSDNLDTHTYHIFEMDPVKYAQYQKAIAQALLVVQEKNYLSQTSEGDTHNGLINGSTEQLNGKEDGKCVRKGECNDSIVVMVLGAGRGPLVRATLNAADITNCKVKVIAVEKNPCAVVVLAAQVREVWRHRDVEVISGDMRAINIPQKANIIVSELLGSWGDNELSPECLDGAAGLLKPGGICIPHKYTSYVAPVSSPKIWASAKNAVLLNECTQQICRDRNFETLWVVYMQNKYFIGTTKPVFTFEHPAHGEIDENGQERRDYRGLPITDNRRCTVISWRVDQETVLHGFGGYFDCNLFGDKMISILPSTHNPNMISWFPVFIPIKTPMRIQKDDIIKATFWRCVDTRRVWYEWKVQVGDYSSCIHNPNGRSSQMLLD